MKLKITSVNGRAGKRTKKKAVSHLGVAVVLALLTGASLLAQAAAGPLAEPTIGYWTDTNAVIADADGQEIRSFPDFDKFSLSRNVLAGERRGKRLGHARIVAYDIASGERLFRIPEARLPVVTAGGKRIAFAATQARAEDDSVWMRMAGGRLRKLARFSPGPGLPGIRHGMRAGALPLDYALDKRGRTMALVGGLESIRSFDVWLVDVRTKKATRLTRGTHSHMPSVSPDGSKVAVRVESTATCSHEIEGEYFMGKIRVITPATGERKTLTRFDCDHFYNAGSWTDNDSLIATRITRDAGEEFGFDLDLVRIDVATGAITELLTDGNPCCLVVSASLGKVAYEFADRPGFGVLDVESGTVVDFPAGHYVPHLSGQNRL
jgi:hypothetical protein